MLVVNKGIKPHLTRCLPDSQPLNRISVTASLSCDPGTVSHDYQVEPTDTNQAYSGPQGSAVQGVPKAPA